MTEPAAPEQFVGTWRLGTMRADRGAGAPGEPHGPQPLGYITYTADGHMHAILMQPIPADTAAQPERASASCLMPSTVRCMWRSSS